TGVRPPLFTLVAVRAMAPVAGIPPKRGEAILATPGAINSMFDRGRPPIMPSATTADNSDPTAARRALVHAAPTSEAILSPETAGNWGRGRPALISPNRDPTVSTGSENRCTIAVAATSATSGAGMRRLNRGQKMMVASVSAERRTAVREIEWRFPA